MFKKILILSILIFLFILSASANNLGNNNLLKNGNFEIDSNKDGIPDHWGEQNYNSNLDSQAKKGSYSLKIQNNIKQNNCIGVQIITVNGKLNPKLTISAWVKHKNIIAGKESWHKARIQVLFFDKEGTQIGGWPELGAWTGSSNWKYYSRTFKLPRKTHTVKILPGLWHCTGTVWFDDIQAFIRKEKKKDPYNFLIGGDFETWEGWIHSSLEETNLSIDFPGYNSDGCLKVSNHKKDWSFAIQSVSVNGSYIRKIKILAMVKYYNIKKGIYPWQQGRLYSIFLDKNGQQLFHDDKNNKLPGGGWLEIGKWTESSVDNWTRVEKSFIVPKATRSIIIFAGLQNVTGTIWFDHIRMFAYRENRTKVLAPKNIQTNTKQWFDFIPPEKNDQKSIIDISHLVEAPAGKHGYIKIGEDGHFYFGNKNKRIRFWGTTLYGSNVFIPHKKAEILAKKLAKYGCNFVSIHHIDAPWVKPNIFDSSYDDTQHYNENSLDKLDYLIFQLKKNGIYIQLDLQTARKFKKGDNIRHFDILPNGAKIVSFFDPNVQRLQKKYIEDILSHYNPYTKKTYAKDPAIVSTLITNEDMLYQLNTQFWLPEYYSSQLNALWNRWLSIKYKDRSTLEKSWIDTFGKSNLKPDENPNNWNVSRGLALFSFMRGSWHKTEYKRERDTMEFYQDLEIEYFKNMHNHIKNLGFKGTVAGSNHWINVDADIMANSMLTHIDRHRYWDKPLFGKNTEVILKNKPMVKQPTRALFTYLANYKVKNKPLLVGAWNSCWPNQYQAEIPMLMAAYSTFQDWDAVIQFSFNNTDWQNIMVDNFNINQNPYIIGQWIGAATLFHRQDVKPAKKVFTKQIGKKEIYGLMGEDSIIYKKPFLPLIHGIQRFYSDKEESKITHQDAYKDMYVLYNKTDDKAVSDTKELVWWGNKGIFKINTNKTQSAVGFLKAVGNITLKNLKLSEIKTNFAAITLTSLDKLDISTSKHLLLTVASRAENSNMIYNASEMQLENHGESPILLEGVNALITIDNFENITTTTKVYALDINGKRIKEIKIRQFEESIRFRINSNDKTMYYEIVQT